MFQKYVVLVDYMRFSQPEVKGNNWAVREAYGVNGRHFGVWRGPETWQGRGDLAISGLSFVFKSRDAAEFEMTQLVARGSMAGVPTLYTVSALTISKAIEFVVAQVYGGDWRGAKRLL